MFYTLLKHFKIIFQFLITMAFVYTENFIVDNQRRLVSKIEVLPELIFIRITSVLIITRVSHVFVYTLSRTCFATEKVRGN